MILSMTLKVLSCIVAVVLTYVGDDEEVYLHQQQQQQHSSDPEATTSSESEDGPSEVSVLFGTLSQAVAAHWMAHIDKLELERKKGLWRRSEQLQQICTELQV